MPLFDFLRSPRVPRAAVGATLVLGEAQVLSRAEAFLARLEQKFTRLCLGVVDMPDTVSSLRPLVSFTGSDSQNRKTLSRLSPARIVVLGRAPGACAFLAKAAYPVQWVNAEGVEVPETTRVLTISAGEFAAMHPHAVVTGDPLLGMEVLPDVGEDTGFCARFKEFRMRNQWVGYFAATGEGEEDFAYRTFMQLSRGQMGLLVLAPQDPARYEPVYRDAIKYRLPTNRHLRLITSTIPYKTRVYYIEDKVALLSMYRCADFVIAGGTLNEAAGHVPDLLTPLLLGKPVIVGPAHRDQPIVRAAMRAGLALPADDVDAVVQVAKEVIADGDLRTRFGEAGPVWVRQQVGAAGRVLALIE